MYQNDYLNIQNKKKNKILGGIKMFDLKGIIENIKERKMREKYLNFGEKMRKDFVLIIKDIMQEDNKLSKEADELLGFYIKNVKEFCRDAGLEDYKDFMDALVEYNFIHSISDIMDDMKESGDFKYYAKRMKSYAKAKAVLRDKMCLQERGDIANILNTLDKIMGDEIPVEILDERKLFLSRTAMCDKIEKLLGKIRNTDNDEELDLLDNELKTLIDVKFNLDEEKRDIEDVIDKSLVVKENLMLSKSNEDSLYYVRMEMNAEEFEKVKNLLRLAYSTSNVGIAIKDEKAILVTNCKSKAEVYIIFRMIFEFNINFENLFINRFMKNIRSNQNVITYGGFFTRDIVEELLKNGFLLDEAIMDNLHDSLVVITSNGTELRLEALKNLSDTPVKYFSDKNNLNLTGEAFSSLAFSLYNVTDRDYSKYVILFTYILLNAEDKEIRKLLDASSASYNTLERTHRIVDAFERLDFVNPNLNFDTFKMNIQNKVKEAMEKEDFDKLTTVMDIVISTFIVCMISIHVHNMLMMYNQDTVYQKVN